MKKVWIVMASITVAATLFVITGVTSASAMMGGGSYGMSYGNYGGHGGYNMMDSYNSRNNSRGYGNMMYGNRYSRFGNMMNNWYRGYRNSYMNRDR